MKALSSLTLADIATRHVLGVPPDCPIGVAARRMGETRISCLVILDGTQPSGIITERDLIRLFYRQTAASTTVRDVMTSPVVTAPLDLDFRSAYRLLRQRGIRHLIAVDSAGGLGGVATATDFRVHLGFDTLRNLEDLQPVLDPSMATLAPDAVLLEGIEGMVCLGWDYVLVVKDDRPLGILTERDVPLLLAAGVRPEDVTLREVMSTPVHTIEHRATIPEVVARMARLRVRHIAVIAEKHRLLGVLSQDVVLDRFSIEIFDDASAECTPSSLEPESSLAVILDATGIGTWQYALSLDRCRCSRTTAAMLGYPDGWQPEHLAAWVDLIHPDDRAVFLQTLEAAKSASNGGDRYDLSYRLCKKDGGWLSVAARLRVTTRNAADQPLTMVGTLADRSPR